MTPPTLSSDPAPALKDAPSATRTATASVNAASPKNTSAPAAQLSAPAESTCPTATPYPTMALDAGLSPASTPGTLLAQPPLLPHLRPLLPRIVTRLLILPPLAVSKR